MPMAQSLEEGVVVQGARASAFFINSSNADKKRLFEKVLNEVNQEQKEVVKEFGEAGT